MISNWERSLKHETNVDWHLVHVDSLFNTKLRNQYVEGCIKYIDNLGLTDNRSVSLGQVRNEDAEEEVGGLLLCQFRRIAFAGRHLAGDQTRMVQVHTCYIVERFLRQHLYPW